MPDIIDTLDADEVVKVVWLNQLGGDDGGTEDEVQAAQGVVPEADDGRDMGAAVPEVLQ
jgi:hypothetical protein